MSIARPFDALGRRIGLSGSGIRTAAAHGLHLWITNGVVAAFGFVTPLAFARLAAPEDYGRFSLVASILAIANAATLPGLNISLTQAAARDCHGALGDVLKLRLRWAAFAAAALVPVALWIAAAGDAATGRVLLLLVPVLPLVYGMDVAQPFMNGLQRFAALSVWMLLAAALPSAVVVAFLLIGGLGPAAAIVGYFATLGSINVGSYAWAARYRTNERSDPLTIAYGKRLTLITSLGTMQAYTDKLVVGGILGLQPLAIYSVGKLFQQGLKITWGALHQLYFPKLASRDVSQARHLTRATLPYVWSAFAVIALVGILAAPTIVRVVFGPAYEASIPVSRVLMLAVLLAIPGAQFEVLFRSTSDEPRLYKQRISFAVSELALMAAGAFLFGLPGAAGAAAIAYAFNSVHGFLLDRRR
jgi:O-antigen/teichoic acid export membrane protein